jgi:hypothetical protein
VFWVKNIVHPINLKKKQKYCPSHQLKKKNKKPLHGLFFDEPSTWLELGLATHGLIIFFYFDFLINNFLIYIFYIIFKFMF